MNASISYRFNSLCAARGSVEFAVERNHLLLLRLLMLWLLLCYWWLLLLLLFRRMLHGG